MAKKKKNKTNSSSAKIKKNNNKTGKIKDKKNNINETTKVNKKITKNVETNDALENKELIISKEINVDKNFNIKDKKKVKQLGKTIEKFNCLENIKETRTENDNITDTNSSDVKEKNHYLYWDNAKDGIIDIKEVNDAVSYDTNQRQKFILLSVCVSIIAIILIVVTFYYSSLRANNKKDNIAYEAEVNESVKK